MPVSAKMPFLRVAETPLARYLPFQLTPARVTFVRFRHHLMMPAVAASSRARLSTTRPSDTDAVHAFVRPRRYCPRQYAFCRLRRRSRQPRAPAIVCQLIV